MRTLAPRLVLGLALLIWMALPIVLELRPPFDWEVPLGNVLNADPEPPWPSVLHTGESEAVPGSSESDFANLLPEPAIHHGVEALRSEPDGSFRDTVIPVVDLLTLHQRRNE